MCSPLPALSMTPGHWASRSRSPALRCCSAARASRSPSLRSRSPAARWRAAWASRWSASVLPGGPPAFLPPHVQDAPPWPVPVPGHGLGVHGRVPPAPASAPGMRAAARRALRPRCQPGASLSSCRYPPAGNWHWMTRRAWGPGALAGWVLSAGRRAACLVQAPGSPGPPRAPALRLLTVSSWPSMQWA